MLRHNSLLKIKEAKCTECGKIGPIQAKGKCHNCYWADKKRGYALKYSAALEEENDEESVAILKKDADLLFSRLIRLRAAAPETGILECYICGAKIHYSQAHAMHFVKRLDSITRLHPKNVRPGCFQCNVTKEGNLVEFRKKLDEEENLLSDWLEAQGRSPEKFWRDDLKRMIADYSAEINHLKKVKKLK